MNPMNENIDELIYRVYYPSDEEERKKSAEKIRELSLEAGIFPSSLHEPYRTFGKREINFTVPAFNVRFLPYHTMRAIFRKAKEMEAGWFILEIARSEIEYTGQTPLIYSSCVMAAAAREGFRGPVFIQGDHFQVRRNLFMKEPRREMEELKGLIGEAIEAGFFNIDIDASTLVALEEDDPLKEQELNAVVTAELVEFIREKEPRGVRVNIGGEIGEIGRRNSTPQDLRAFMTLFLREVQRRKIEGITKISIQTGTKHGGFVLADGSLARVDVDFDTIRELSLIARKEFGLGGVVQHGASTLPHELFSKFPEAGTLEIHLATGFQNLLFSSRNIPDEIKREMFEFVMKRFAEERKEGETEEQFFYRMRKWCAGAFNRKLWFLDEKNLEGFMKEVEDSAGFFFRVLRVAGTARESRQILRPRA